MYCVENTVIIEDTIKISRFLGLAIPCQSAHAALQHIAQLQHQHPHANHIVFAYRIQSPQGLLIKFHDAGEPSGTAGKPVYQHLEGKDLINLLVVVVRYFGGIKLGAGGLTRAYSNTARKVIENSILTEYIEYVKIELTLDYNQMQSFEYQLKKLKGDIIQQIFAENVKLLISVPQGQVSTLTHLFKRIRFKMVG